MQQQASNRLVSVHWGEAVGGARSQNGGLSQACMESISHMNMRLYSGCFMIVVRLTGFEGLDSPSHAWTSQGHPASMLAANRFT
jgi:hypothetical protein